MAKNTAPATELDLNNLSEDDFSKQEDKVVEIKEEKTEKPKVEPKAQEPEVKEDEKKSEEVEETAKEEDSIEELIATLEKELENTNVRYESSSAEGKRLFKQNKELKEELSAYNEVKPVLNILANNPELQSIAKEMINGTYQGNLPEETLDLDDAVRNPGSASAKVLKTLVQREAAKMVSSQNTETKASSKQSKENALNDEIESVSKEMGLSETEVGDILEYGRNVSFKDVVKLYNYEKGNGAEPKKASVDMAKLLDQIKQLNKTSKMEKNVRGTNAVEVSDSQKVQNAIMQAGDNDLNELIPT